MVAGSEGSDGGKVLRVGMLAGGYHLDPLTAQDVDSFFVLRQIVESPFGAQAGSTELEPLLFTEGLRREPGSDPPVYRARLRPGVEFSNGAPLLARDVVECLARVALIRDQADVEARGDEIVFSLKRPNARFDMALSHPQCAIHRLERGRLIGTGPYQIAEGGSLESFRLVRNPRYRHEVPIGEVRFDVYPPDADGAPTALLQALHDGEVDFTNTLARDDINRLSQLRKSFLPGISTALLYLNTESPQLRDRRVRQAVARSIDRIEVARTSYMNALAFAAPSILPRSLGAADDGLSFDPGAAAEILAEPGVVLPKRLRMLMMWAPRPYLPHPHRFRDALTEQLGSIGIEIEPIPTASSAEFTGRLIAGDYDASLSGWVADTMDPADFLEANLASSRVPDHENISVSTNGGRLRSEAMDRALERFRADGSSGSLEEVMNVLSEEAPLVPLAYGPTTAVVSFRVKNFKPSPLSIFPLSQLDVE